MDVFTNPMFDPRKGSSIVATELNELRLQIIKNMRAADAVASGQTIRSLHVRQSDFSAKLMSEQKMPFGTLETGRRGYRYPDNRKHIPSDFQTIIYQWMKIRGISADDVPPYKGTKYASAQERADWSMASAIAWKISLQGTKLFRQGGRNNIYSTAIPKTIEECKRRLSAFLAASTVESIKLNKPVTKIGRNG